MKYFEKVLIETDNFRMSFYQEPGRCFVSIGVNYDDDFWGDLFVIRFLWWELDLEFYNSNNQNKNKLR